ncbi:hypothetical protein H4R20_005670 [Coemansia guatemalensis]|uniref:L-dopachrome isomerase n=1 Tax=Coemansia guatemalensis TaxID=2761395 RepID=A0A9W8HPX5_9FUNG|nr:hypothetical protein H4R20_005670 [Coemansia guatemalensis]
MPHCEVTTNVQAADPKELSLKAASVVAELLSKPLSFVTSIVNYNAGMICGGSDAPAAYIMIGSIGSVGGSKNAPIIAGVTKLFSEALGISPERINVEIRDIPRGNYGINGAQL